MSNLSNARLLRNFQRVYAIDRWLRNHLTPAGQLLSSACIAAAVLGIDTRRTVAYQIFSVLAALFLWAGLYAWRMRLPLVLKRCAPTLATVGQPFYYTVICQQTGTNPIYNLTLQESLPVPFPTAQQFQQFTPPTEQQRNWFDRKVGYPRWLQLIRQHTPAIALPQTIPVLLPDVPLSIPLQLTPQRRGCLCLNRFYATTLEPLGILHSAHSFISQEDIVWVLPAYYPVAPLPLLKGRRYQPGGISLAAAIGESNEFLGLRDYRPGDTIRHIHWRSWAKTGKPVIKEYQDEFFIRYGIVLDTFTQPGPAFEAAISTAASLLYAAQNQEAIIDLMFIEQQAYCFTTGRGLSSLDQMLRILASVEAIPQQPFQQLAQTVLSRTALLSACIAILTDWDEPRQHWLTQLRQRGVPVIGLIVRPKTPAVTAELLPEQVYWVDADQLPTALRELPW